MKRMSSEQLNDLDFVRFFFDRSNHKEYLHVLDKSLLCYEAVSIINALPDYYTEFPNVSRVDFSSFATWFTQLKLDTENPDTKKKFKAFLKLVEEKTEESTLDAILKGLSTKSALKELKDIKEKDLTAARLKELAVKIESCSVDGFDVDELICSTDYDQLFLEDPFSSGLDWAFNCLNTNINKIPDRGFFMCVAGRPGACKSSFLLQNVVHIAKQIPRGSHIIWFNNEGSIEEMKRRFAVAVTGRDKDYIINKSRNGNGGTVQQYIDKVLDGADKVVFVELAHKGLVEAEKVLKKYKDTVRLIIVDMLDNVNIKHQFRHISNSDALFGILYQWWLGAACLYAPVIGTSQMNVVDDPRYPKLENLVGSKNLKQGAVSCQLMIGHEEQSNVRYLSTPKNKYGKGGTTWSGTLIFNESTCQFREVE